MHSTKVISSNAGIINTATKNPPAQKAAATFTIIRKQTPPSLFHKKPIRRSAGTNTTSYNPQIGASLKKVKASGVLKTTEIIKCGGHVDTGSRRRGLTYMIQRKMVVPTYWYALGDQA